MFSMQHLNHLILSWLIYHNLCQNLATYYKEIIFTLIMIFGEQFFFFSGDLLNTPSIIYYAQSIHYQYTFFFK